MTEYNHKPIEAEWSRKWTQEKTYCTDLRGAERPYYNLMMFPYPSAKGLHVGNVFAFVGSDVHGRFMRARGFDVFEPFGFDAFGIHSENHAIQVGEHPTRLTPRNVEHYREGQMKRLGGMFNWTHEVDTTDPAYYRWTQWLFIKLFEAGLAYRKQAPVNWCPGCKTVLSNEQAEGGTCERCDSEVETREMRQWFLRITDYAQRLLDNLEWIDWSPKTKKAQQYWIGRDEETGDYRLHDWCISRQRYWGTPIPVIHCDECGAVPVSEDDLPVLLPFIEGFGPDGSGDSPLSRDEAFVKATCPRCGRTGRRETDVCDNFLDSAWYFLRYPSSGCEDVAFDQTLTAKWLPVDMYIGGNEHAVLHLMYTRFVTMALHDMGLVSFEEPFRRFRTHGLLIKDGAKMSKSKPNAISPDAYIDKYGADVLRTYLMFLGPYQEGGDFQDTGIVGIQRFIEKMWRYITATEFGDGPVSDRSIVGLLHRSIKKVTGDVGELRYNTAIAALMKFLNGLSSQDQHWRECARVLLQLVCPFAPFVAHELWGRLGGIGLVDETPWPDYDEALTQEDRVNFIIQVNGHVRGRMTIARDMPRRDIEAAAMACERVIESVDGACVVKKVFVPGKLLNIVTARRE